MDNVIKGSGDLIGGAFVEIGGDNTKLRKAWNASLRMTQDSLATMAKLSSDWSASLSKGFADVGRMLQGPTGIVAGLGGMFSAIVDIERVAVRLSKVLATWGLDEQGVRDIFRMLEAKAAGTPFSVEKMRRAALTMLEGGVAPGQLAEAIELAIGATVKNIGMNLQQAAGGIAGAFRGAGGAGVGLTLPAGPLNMQLEFLRSQLLPQAQYGRGTLFRDPLAGGAGVIAARMADKFHEVLSGAGNRLFGGFTQAQQVLAAQQAYARETGLGPTARGMGFYRTGQLQGVPGLFGMNAAEVQALLAQQVGEPEKGALGDFANAIETATGAAEDFGNVLALAAEYLMKFEQGRQQAKEAGIDLIDSFFGPGVTGKGRGKYWATAGDARNLVGELIQDSIAPGTSGDLEWLPYDESRHGGAPSGQQFHEVIKGAVRQGVREGMADQGVRPAVIPR